MLYIFMDNYRGFSETLIPLRRATFLVGENSTGKSSFLSLAYLLSTPALFLDRSFSPSQLINLGGFKDIVSIASEDRSYFTVGTLDTRPNKRDPRTKTDCVFTLMRFCDEEGMPRLSSYALCAKGMLTTIHLHQNKPQYRVEPDAVPDDEGEIRNHFLKVQREMVKSNTGFEDFPADFPRDAPLPLFLGFISSSQERNSTRKDQHRFHFEFPSFYSEMMTWTWLAPVRARPGRIYDWFKTEFSAEGDHTPYPIRKSLSQEKATKFGESLSKFGKASGLFTEIDAHTFGNDPSTPFEVRVGLDGQLLNIANVGYGVSQVLPVVVEMVTRPKDGTFALQQPEVHLHPRAQAALGGLIHSFILEKQHRYIVETHSDYLIDRFRLQVKKAAEPKDAQVIFFERGKRGNKAHILRISDKGRYPEDQPDEFRRFFIKEEASLLEL